MERMTRMEYPTRQFAVSSFNCKAARYNKDEAKLLQKPRAAYSLQRISSFIHLN
jgi:hypothetical protein